MEDFCEISETCGAVFTLQQNFQAVAHNNEVAFSPRLNSSNKRLICFHNLPEIALSGITLRSIVPHRYKWMLHIRTVFVSIL